MSASVRLRKSLLEPLRPAIWPPGYALIPLSAVQPYTIHKLLVDAYVNGFGQVAEFDAWWMGLVGDLEFDPALVFVVADMANRPVGVAQCWTGAFVKDIAIDADHRGKGLGAALLWTVFAALRSRGATHVDLKVDRANAHAQRLYAHVGMVEAPL